MSQNLFRMVGSVKQNGTDEAIEEFNVEEIVATVFHLCGLYSLEIGTRYGNISPGPKISDRPQGERPPATAKVALLKIASVKSFEATTALFVVRTVKFLNGYHDKIDRKTIFWMDPSSMLQYFTRKTSELTNLRLTG